MIFFVPWASQEVFVKKGFNKKSILAPYIPAMNGLGFGAG
jgi:hypothetical protein